MQSQKRQHVGAGVPDREAYDVSQDKAGSHRVVQRLRGYPMNEKKPTYRVEIKYSGTPPNETYGWKNPQELGCLTHPAITATLCLSHGGIS